MRAQKTLSAYNRHLLQFVALKRCASPTNSRLQSFSLANINTCDMPDSKLRPDLRVQLLEYGTSHVIKIIYMCRTCDYTHDMSRMIQVRNVPDTLHRTLKIRAAMAGVSLSDYL